MFGAGTKGLNGLARVELEHRERLYVIEQMRVRIEKQLKLHAAFSGIAGLDENAHDIAEDCAAQLSYWVIDSYHKKQRAPCCGNSRGQEAGHRINPGPTF